MAKGVALQEALEQGAMEQWTKALNWAAGVLTVIETPQHMYWVDLIGVPQDSREVRRVREELVVERFKKVGLYEKVPLQQARDRGRQVLKC